MASVEVECGECGWTMEVEKSQLGETLKCPKCKMSFVAEAAGAYGLAGDAGVETEPPEVERPRASGKPKAAGDGGAKKRAKEGGRAETEAERKLREKMERWAED